MMLVAYASPGHRPRKEPFATLAITPKPELRSTVTCVKQWAASGDPTLVRNEEGLAILAQSEIPTRYAGGKTDN